MEKLPDDVKSFLCDVEKFLVENLEKDEDNLSVEAKSRRNNMVNRLRMMKQGANQPPPDDEPGIYYEETEQNGSPAEGPDEVYEDVDAVKPKPASAPSVKANGAKPGSKAAARAPSVKLQDAMRPKPHKSSGSTSDISDSHAVPVAARAIPAKDKEGYLYRIKAGQGFKKLFSRAKKVYVVVKRGTVYIYDSEKDVKQKLTLHINGYVADTQDTNSKKGEHLFTLGRPDEPEKALVLVAETTEERERWVHVLAKAGKQPPYIHDPNAQPESRAEKPSNSAAAAAATPSRRAAPPEPAEPEAIYELTDGPSEDYDDTVIGAPPARDQGSRSGKPAPPPPADDIYDDTADPQDIYDDTVTADPPQDIYDDTAEIPQEIYDDVAVPDASGGGTDTKEEQPEDEPPPDYDDDDEDLYSTIDVIQNPDNTVEKLDDDMSRYYYSLWDCIGNNVEELSFKAGELIYVVNKDFDAHSWWVGELNGLVGLVPKTYLSPAYELTS